MSNILELSSEDVLSKAKERSEPNWIGQQRVQAWEKFNHTPPPAHTAEAWKYTNLEKLAGWNRTEASAWDSMDGEYKFVKDLPQSVVFCDLHTALNNHAELVKPYLTVDSEARRKFATVTGTTFGGERYLAQHEALWDRGFFIYVPKNVVVEQHLTALHNSMNANTAIFPRTIIVLEEGASLTFVEEFNGNGLSNEDLATCSARAEIYCGANSQMQYVSVQRWPANVRHVMHQQAILKRDARYSSTSIHLGGKIIKHVNETVLAEPGSEGLIFGLAFGENQQHIDNHTLQTHLAPNTHSDLLYKTALKGDAKSIYTGLIGMGPLAQQSQAYQACRNLLLSEGCSANAVPQLEIEANDVKCSHGATMGPVNEDQCFYLMSRGLSRLQAEQMIATGFFEELIAKLPDAQLADITRAIIERKLES